PSCARRNAPSIVTASTGSPAFHRPCSVSQAAPSHGEEKSSAVTCSDAHLIAALSARAAPMTARSASSVPVDWNCSSIFQPFRLGPCLRGGGLRAVVGPPPLVQPGSGEWDVLRGRLLACVIGGGVYCCLMEGVGIDSRERLDVGLYRLGSALVPGVRLIPVGERVGLYWLGLWGGLPRSGCSPAPLFPWSPVPLFRT